MAKLNDKKTKFFNLFFGFFLTSGLNFAYRSIYREILEDANYSTTVNWLIYVSNACAVIFFLIFLYNFFKFRELYL